MKKVAILLILISCVTMTGCQSNNSGENDAVSSSVEQDVTENSYNLNSDLYDFDVLINDKQYSLPFDFQEMKDENWEISENTGKSETLSSGESKAGYEITLDGNILNVNFINLSEEELEIEKCSVGAIEYTRENEEVGITLELTKNITINSTREEIIEAYGEPSKEENGTSSCVLYYKIGSEEYVQFDIDSTDNKISSIKIENYNNTSNNNTSNETNTTDDSDDTEYPVRELGDDLFSRYFELDGVVYELPASLDEMSKDGWSVKYEDEEYIEPDSMISVKLRKGNYLISTIAENTGTEKIKLEDAPVRYIKINKDDTSISMKLPGGIEIGTTKDELDSILSSYEVTINESSDSKIDYKLKDNGYEISITVDRETSAVKEIIIAIYS